VILLIAASAALLYAILGATVTDPDSYGTVPIPSESSVELPGQETEISLAFPAAAAAAVLPSDLRISIAGADGTALRVDARGGESYEQDDLSIRPVAAVFPPAAGAYEVRVTSEQAAGRSGQLMFGEGPIGSIGARFERLGELVTGPFGVLAGVLLLIAVLLPPFRRAVARQR
jgi:hypothetical protein